MLKYHSTFIGFREVPDEVSLCINISGCKHHCKGCHSPFLQEDTGTSLNKTSLLKLLQDNDGITCVAFMGGDHLPHRLVNLAAHIKYKFPNLKLAWYSGDNDINKLPSLYRFVFDYIKIGGYKEEFGPLDSVNTNQRMYKIDHSDDSLEDITYKFQKHYETKDSD